MLSFFRFNKLTATELGIHLQYEFYTAYTFSSSEKYKVSVMIDV